MSPIRLKPGHNVPDLAASGGLGVFGVQLCAAAGANAIGVISDETERDYVLSLGAKGVINRKEFNCSARLPKVNSQNLRNGRKKRVNSVRRSGISLAKKMSTLFSNILASLPSRSRLWSLSAAAWLSFARGRLAST